jgi:hypothetical protein
MVTTIAQRYLASLNRTVKNEAYALQQHLEAEPAAIWYLTLACMREASCGVLPDDTRYICTTLNIM